MTVLPKTLRLGTRASLLARTQSGHVADALSRALGCDVELVDVTTEGDVSSAPLASFGGVGVFVSAVRDALVRGEVDLAVHSLKDLPTAEHPDVVIAAVPLREDPRDVVVARDGLTLGELPAGSRIGTGSPRRAAQLHALGLGFDVVGIRGNVDTRIRKVAEGEVDAVVLARAGVARLGRLDEVTEVLDPLQMLPAPGQGALAVECRRTDADLVRAVAEAIDDVRTRAAVTVERAVLASLEAGCSAPVGALGLVSELGFSEPELTLEALVASPDGSSVVRMSITAPLLEADAAGRQLAARLLDSGVPAISREHL